MTRQQQFMKLVGSDLFLFFVCGAASIASGSSGHLAASIIFAMTAGLWLRELIGKVTRWH
jgi:hypothetical protein